TRPPPTSHPFPYTTLFRSRRGVHHGDARAAREHLRQDGGREQGHDDHAEADPETLRPDERLDLPLGHQPCRGGERRPFPGPFTRVTDAVLRILRGDAHQMTSLKISSNEGSTGVKLRTAPRPNAARNTS